jgi:hypothetical protein
MQHPDVMAAVAMAESSGRTDVVNSIGCVGLWQINQPVHVKSHPTWTVAWLKNPVNNAMAAKVIFAQQGMDAWEAYTDGSYANFMKSGVTQVADDDCHLLKLAPEAYKKCKEGWKKDNPEPPHGLDQLDTLATLGKALVKATAWVSDSHNWIRIAYVGGGAAIALVGLNMLSRGQLMNMLPVGKVAKVAKAAT